MIYSGRSIAAAAIAAAWSMCVPPATAGQKEMPVPSRPAPPVVLPVQADGVRYEPRVSVEGEYPGGFVDAVDEKTQSVLWTSRIYGTPATERAPGTMPIYFRSLKLSPDRTRLTIADEVGRSFELDLRTRAVRSHDLPPRAAEAGHGKPRPD